MTDQAGISRQPEGASDGASNGGAGSGATGPSAVPRLVKRLRDLAKGRETVSLGDITHEIGAQGHAPLLMIVAILMILPIGMIPGVGGALGALVSIIGLQMLLGRDGVWLPRFLARRNIAAHRVATTAERILPAAEWVRRHLHPRWEAVSSGRVSLSVIAVILMLTGASLMVLGVIPIAAPLIGLPVAVYAFGILGRDGIVVTAGHVLIAAVFAGLWLMRGG